MVNQLKHHDKNGHAVSTSSSIENLRKATAHLFRNLAWKADKNSKQILSDSEVVGVLLQSAMDVTIAASGVEKCIASEHDIFSSIRVLPKEAEQFLKVDLTK